MVERSKNYGSLWHSFFTCIKKKRSKIGMITSGTRGGDMTQVTIGQIQRGDSDERSLSRVGPRD